MMYVKTTSLAVISTFAWTKRCFPLSLFLAKRSVHLIVLCFAFMLLLFNNSAQASGGGAASSSGGSAAPTADQPNVSAPVNALLTLSNTVTTTQRPPIMQVVVKKTTRKRTKATKKPYVNGWIVVTNTATGQVTAKLHARKIRFAKPRVIQWTADASKALQPGSYSITFSVVDSKGQLIPVRDQSKTQSQLTVQAPKPIPTNPGCAQDGVFPVVGKHSFGSDGARFNAARTGHTHEGQDVLATEGQQIVAPVCGKVFQTTTHALAGEYVVVNGNDGRAYFFAHCQAKSTTVKVGQIVNAGDNLCNVGQTGDASGPHLHFEIWVMDSPADPNGRGAWRSPGSRPIDPLPQLLAWDK